MRILIYGATGNIGQQVVNYLKHTKHKIVGISYCDNFKLAQSIKAKFYFSPHKKSNVSSYEELIIKSKPDLIINAIVGFAGLEITLLSIKHKIDLALANKESMVVAGRFITKLAKKNKVNIYPIDSEHTSLMHIIKNSRGKPRMFYITASGGPFYNVKHSRLDKITYKQAIKHPTWKMGGKISIDSATLMNKCFEIIECF
jgi:1-deoxy-D-xylulose-5-phosphate reductoisomerase